MLILYFNSRWQRHVGLNFYQEGILEKEVEQTCEEGQEEEGDVEKDTGSSRRKDRAEVILDREADVWKRKTSEAGPLIG